MSAVRNTGVEPVRRHSPEKALLCAVLERAWNDLINDNVSHDDQRSARNWFISPSTEGYSFLWAAGHLDWSEEQIAIVYLQAFSTESDLSLGERIDFSHPSSPSSRPCQSPLVRPVVVSSLPWSLLS